MAIRPALKPKLVKKRTNKFIRHQSDRYVKVKVSTVPVSWQQFSLLGVDFVCVIIPGFGFFFVNRTTGGNPRVLITV